MSYSLFFQVWPWMGLGAAIVLILIASLTDLFRVDLNIERFRDPSWLAWISVVGYMLHNVEEYGIDLFGVTMSFPKLMASLMGGNVSELAYLSCNIGAIWIVAPILAYLSRKYKGIAPSFAIFMLVNAIVHLRAYFIIGYNPGLFTALVIFIPVGLWNIYICYGKGKISLGKCIASFGISALYTIILLLGIQLAVHGMINDIAQGLVMVVDNALCLYLWYVLGKKASKELA